MRNQCQSCGTNDDGDTIMLLVCGGCSGVMYCSTRCQQKHWGVHRKQCQRISCLALLEAIDDGNKKAVIRLLKLWYAIHSPGLKSALYHCIEHLNIAMLKILLRKRSRILVEVDSIQMHVKTGRLESSIEKTTPLIYAIYKGNRECVRILLEAGANPDRTPDDGRIAPIMAALLSEDYAMVKMLLGAKANLEQKHLEFAVFDMKSYPMTELILKANCSLGNRLQLKLVLYDALLASWGRCKNHLQRQGESVESTREKIKRILPLLRRYYVHGEANKNQSFRSTLTCICLVVCLIISRWI